jgi:hypothetical protein
MPTVVEVLKACPEGTSPEDIAAKLEEAGLIKPSPDTEESGESGESGESEETEDGEGETSNSGASTEGEPEAVESDTPELDAVTDSPKAPAHSDESYMAAISAAMDEMKAKAKNK